MILLCGLQRYYEHPKGCCCRVYKGTTSPYTPRTPQGMLLWGLQRYYLSPHTPRDAAVGFTKVLPLPPHPKGCCCGVYKSTTSPHTPQGMLLWGLQRYYLSPHTPRDAAVGFTKVLPLPRHPHTPRDAAVGFTKVLPLPTHPVHPNRFCCGMYKGTTSPHTPRTSQGMQLSGVQRNYLSPHTPCTLRDAAVGFTKVLPLPTHPKGCSCGVYKGTASPQTSQGVLLSGVQRYYLSPDTPCIPRDSAVECTEVRPLPTHPVHPKGFCCGVYKGTTSPQTPRTPQGMLLWGLQKYYLSQDTLHPK